MADDSSIVETILLQGLDVANRNLNAFGEAGERAFGKLGTAAKTASRGTSEFSGSLDKTKQSSDQASSGIEGLRTRLTAMSTQLASTGKALRDFGRGWSLYVTAPITAFGGASVAAFTGFQQQMSNVSTLVDTTKESMADMGKQVIALGQRTPVALSDLASALYDIRSAGIDAGSAMKVLEGSAKLAVAGLGTTKEAANIVTSAINAFGLKGKDAENVYAQIFETVKQGKTTIGELSQGFGGVAASVATAGIGIKEFLASTAALTSVGVPAAQAYTQIRTALGGLTTQTAEAKKIFDELGVDSFQQLIQRSGGLVAAFKALVEASHGNQTALVRAVGGMEGYNAVVTLAVKANKAFETAMKGMDNSTKDFTEGFAKQQATLQSTLTVLHNAVTALGISFGSALAPAISAIASSLTGIAHALAALPGPIQTVIAVIAGLLAVIGPLSLGVGLMVTGWANFLSVMARAPQILTALSTGIRLVTGSMGLLRTAITGIRTALTIASAAMGGFPALLALIAAAIGFLIVYLIQNREAIVQWLQDNKAAIERVVSYWTAFEQAVVTVAQAFKNAFTDAANYVSGIFSSLWANITGFFGRIVDALKYIIALGGQAQQAVASVGGGGGGGGSFAGGGHIRGPGTATSDSIPIWASDGEYMMKTKSVQHYGLAFMEAINNMRLNLGHFNMGGLISMPRTPSLRFADGGLVASKGNTLNLTIDGQRFNGLSMTDDVADRLGRFAMRKELSSAGRKPNWAGSGRK